MLVWGIYEGMVMSTWNETDEQREAERRLMNRIAKPWDVSIMQHEKGDRIDGTVFEARTICGFVEVKRRTIRSSDYPDVFIDTDKIVHGLERSQLLSVPLIVLIEWTDTVMWRLTTDLGRIGYNGNRARGDADDRVSYYMINEFQPCTFRPPFVAARDAVLVDEYMQ